jgi:hypothetical protein
MKTGTMVAVALAWLILTLTYGRNGEWGGVLASSGLGLLWITGLWQRWYWLADAGLIGFAGAAGWGIWLDLPAPWLLAGMVAALAAWDLARFARRLELPGRQTVNRAALVRAHLQRLGLAAGLGLLLGETALALTLGLNLGWALLLGLLAVLGLAGLIGLIRRQ